LVSASAAGAFISGAGATATMQAALLGLIFTLIALPCCLLWLAAGATLQQVLRTDRAMRIFNWVMAALLAGSVLFLVR
jgi:threonine/homoserine/homoserine lactone efflux protein